MNCQRYKEDNGDRITSAGKRFYHSTKAYISERIKVNTILTIKLNFSTNYTGIKLT
jgi:hypothetical protein